MDDWSEGVDLKTKLLSGGGASNLPGLPIQETALGTYEAVYSHDFIRVNTSFETGRGNDLMTAYVDKYPTCEFLKGPSGVGLPQEHFPEGFFDENNITSVRSLG